MIDSTDKRILYALDFHARDSFSTLAKSLKISEDTFHYHIKRMEKRGVIISYYIVPNTTKLGKVSYKVMLKYQHIDTVTEKEIITYLVNAKGVGWVVKTDGYYDLMFILWVANEFSFDNFFTKFLEKFSSFFYIRDIVIIIENHACQKAYLYDKKVEKEEVFYAGEAKNICDSVDLKIIEILTINARTSAIDIGKKIGLTAEAVSYRIKDLKKRGVIGTFRPRLDLNKIGYYFYNVLFRLNKTSSIPKFFSYARKNPNVTYFVRYVGSYDLGFDIEVDSPDKLRTILNEIREMFGQYIINYNYVLIYDEVKITY